MSIFYTTELARFNTSIPSPRVASPLFSPFSLIPMNRLVCHCGFHSCGCSDLHTLVHLYFFVLFFSFPFLFQLFKELSMSTCKSRSLTVRSVSKNEQQQQSSLSKFSKSHALRNISVYKNGLLFLIELPHHHTHKCIHAYVRIIFVYLLIYSDSFFSGVSSMFLHRYYYLRCEMLHTEPSLFIFRSLLAVVSCSSGGLSYSQLPKTSFLFRALEDFLQFSRKIMSV